MRRTSTPPSPEPRPICEITPISAESVARDVKAALLEDVGLAGEACDISDILQRDLTAQLIAPSKINTAQVLCRDHAVISGLAWVAQAFTTCDPEVHITWMVKDGDHVSPNTVLFEVTGLAQALLTAERTALNFLQTMSATATVTAHYVALLGTSTTRLLDTRKTLPGMRYAQKYAVQCGGGKNHRIGLADAFLIKENHIMACGGITQAVQAAKGIASDKVVEVEVENTAELHEAVEAGADIIMLDNFTTEQILSAVDFNAGRSKLEVSGNITDERIAELKTTGVDFISTGAITKHIQAIDLSLRIIR